MIKTRFDERIPYFLILATVCSFLLSLFLLQLFAGLLFIIYLFERNENKKKAFDVFIIALLIFFLARIISIIFSEFPSSSVQAIYKDALFYLSFIAFHFYLKILGKEKLIKIISVFVVASVMVALIGILQFDLNLVDRAQSFGSGYSTYSSYLLTGLGLLLFLPDKDKNRNWIFTALGIAIIFTGIITSLGRTNLAIALVMFVAGVFFSKIKFKTLSISILLTVLFAFISFSLNSSGISDRLEKPTQLSDRDIIYKGAKELALEHPVFGFGPRTFHDVFPYKEDFADKGIGSWHNDFLQIYFESGFIGFLAFLFLIGFYFYKSLKYLKNVPPDNNKKIVWGIFFSVSGLVLSAITAGFINSPILALVFGFLVSLFAALDYQKNRRINSI